MPGSYPLAQKTSNIFKTILLIRESIMLFPSLVTFAIVALHAGESIASGSGFRPGGWDREMHRVDVFTSRRRMAQYAMDWAYESYLRCLEQFFTVRHHLLQPHLLFLSNPPFDQR